MHRDIAVQRVSATRHTRAAAGVLALMRPSPMLVAAAAVLLCAACGAEPNPSPSGEGPAPGPVEPRLTLACWSVPAADCERVAAEALARRPVGRPPVAVVEVREGLIDLEYADGGGRDMVPYSVAGDGRLEFTPWTGLFPGSVRPRSGPAPGPIVPFTLGHCGLSSPIDIDGSFWDAYGQIDPNDAFINASDGQFRRLGADEAEFVVPGARVSLRRHVGSKSPPGCD